VQGFSHLLVAIGKPIEASELVSHILAGLGAEYDPLVTSVTTRQDSISLNDLYGYMLSYELRLEHHKSTIDLNISTTNTAQRQSPSHPRNNRGYNSGSRNINFLAAVAMVVVEDHLSNSIHLVLARHNAQQVKYVTN
jgi:hypothetical protein